MDPSVCLESSGAAAFFSRCAFKLRQPKSQQQHAEGGQGGPASRAGTDVFFISAFSWKRFLLKSFARSPLTFCAYCERRCTTRASFLRLAAGTRGVRAGPGGGAGAGAALLALEVVHAEAMALLVQLDVLVLRLHSEERGSASPESARAELLPRSSTRAPAGGGAARSRRRERGRTIGADPRWC